MSDVFDLIRRRQSARTAFDLNRPVSKDDLRLILEAASLAPTAHNMQNFEIVVVDDKAVLKKIGAVRTKISRAFVEENYAQLSFTEDELVRKKTGLLGQQFPPSWRDPKELDIEKVMREAAPAPLENTLRGGPTLLIVLYDPRKRAPASANDVLGFISLGCVMQNIWLAAEALSLGVHIMSAFSGEYAENEIKKILGVPAPLKIAFAVRLGYPAGGSKAYLRVRRDVEDFARFNKY